MTGVADQQRSPVSEETESGQKTARDDQPKAAIDGVDMSKQAPSQRVSQGCLTDRTITNQS